MPSPARVNDPPSIVVSGCRPGQAVTVRARMRDGLGRHWESHAAFEADTGGVVDVTTQRPVAGTYEDADPRGLLWSMRLGEGQPTGLLTSAAPLETEFVVEMGTTPVATARVTRYFAAPDVSRTDVRDHGLVATFFRPAGTMPRPAIIVVPGSGGGVPETSAALLASHGFARPGAGLLPRRAPSRVARRDPAGVLRKGDPLAARSGGRRRPTARRDGRVARGRAGAAAGCHVSRVQGGRGLCTQRHRARGHLGRRPPGGPPEAGMDVPRRTGAVLVVAQCRSDGTHAGDVRTAAAHADLPACDAGPRRGRGRGDPRRAYQRAGVVDLGAG